jgi:Na+/proline symporter
MSSIGWSYYWFTILVIPGLVIPAIFLIRPLRLQSEKLGSLTITEYLGKRYKSPGLKLYISIMCSIFFLFLMVAQFKGASLLLETYTGLSFRTSLIIITAVTVFMVNMGGLRSVAWTDFWQGCFMTVLSVTLVVVVLFKVGGYVGIDNFFKETDPAMLEIIQPSAPGSTFPWYSIPFVGLFTFFLMFSQPYISSRYLALPTIDRKQIGQFLMITLVTGFLFNTMVTMGMAGRMLHTQGVIDPSQPDYLTPTMATTFFHPIFASIMLIGFFSAILSTATSILLVVAQDVGKNIFGELNKKATEKQIILVTQVTSIVVALLILLFNYVNAPPFLQAFVFMGQAGVGNLIAIPMFFGVFWKKSRREGAWVAAILGPLCYVLFNNILGIVWSISMGLAMVPAFLGMVIVSNVLNASKGEDKELVELGTI